MTAIRNGCHILTEKPLAASLAEGREIVAAAAKAGVIHAVMQNRRYLAAVRRIRRFLDSGVLGAPDLGALRLLPRSAFRRLPRRDGPCAAARHGDPHLRRRPGDDRVRGAEGVLPGMEAGRVVVSTGIVGGRGVRSAERRDFQLSRQLVRRRRADQLGGQLADRLRHGTITWDGFDAIRAESVRDSARDGLFDLPLPLEVPAGRAIRPGGRASRRDARFRRGGPQRPARPKPPETDNLKSLGMVFAAIDSAERHISVEIEA